MGRRDAHTAEEGQPVKIVVDRGYANTADKGKPVQIVVEKGYANTADKGTPVQIVVEKGYANTADKEHNVKFVHLVQAVMALQKQNVKYVMGVFMESISTGVKCVRRSDNRRSCKLTEAFPSHTVRRKLKTR